MRVQTAFEVASEFALHVLRQALARALVRVLEEALHVLLDDTVEDGFLGAALLVLLWCGAGHGGVASAMAMPRRVSAGFAESSPARGWRSPWPNGGIARVMRAGVPKPPCSTGRSLGA